MKPKPFSPRPQPGDNRAGSSRRILVIDDEPRITQLVDALLKSQGWTCTLLNDPKVLEVALEGRQFDVVLCDLKMPGRNGLEVLRVIRQLRPELSKRFLLVTGNIADTAEDRSIELATIPVLRKPFTLTDLLEAIESLLHGQG